MAFKVKSEADLPANVLAALRAQGELDATPEPREASHTATVTRGAWGFRRTALVTATVYVGGSLALAAGRALLG